MAIEEGNKIECFEEVRRAKVFDAGKFSGLTNNKAPEVLYIQVDGTGINDRDSGQWMECKSFKQALVRELIYQKIE